MLGLQFEAFGVFAVAALAALDRRASFPVGKRKMQEQHTTTAGIGMVQEADHRRRYRAM